MVLTKRACKTSIAGFSRLFLLSCALVGGAALTTGAPARAGLLNDIGNSDNSSNADKPDDSQQPQRGLFNRIFSPDSTSDKAAPGPGAAPAPAAAPAAAEDDSEKPQRGLFSRMFGSDDSDKAGQDALAQPAPAERPGMFDKAMSSVGLGGPSATSKIDYSERPKLVVPQERAALPPPREGAQRGPIRPVTDDAPLTRPPAEYLEKARGADGKATGLRDGDVPAEKKFFGIF